MGLHASNVNDLAPPKEAYTTRFDVVSAALTYIGKAKSNIPDRWSTPITTISTANPASVTWTDHGLKTGNRVTLSGGTGNWAAINGTHIITVTGVNTFTVPVNSTAFGAITGSIVAKTTAPRTSMPEWSISRNVGDGVNPLYTDWANGSSGMSFEWDERANLAYE